MTSHDDLTLLTQMYRRGQISAERYDVLRRQVLWGTPLAELVGEVPAGQAEPRSRRARREAAEQGSGRDPRPYLPPVGGSVHPPPLDPVPPRSRPAAWPLADTAAYAPFGQAPEDTAARSPFPPPAQDGDGARAGSPAPVRRRGGEPGGLSGSRGRGGTGNRQAPAERGPAPARPRRRRRRRSLPAVLTSVVLALALVGAGVWWLALRDAGVPPAEYALAVCGSVRDWQKAVDSGGSALVSSIAREDDRRVVRSAVRAYYTGLAGRTDQLRIAVIDAGVADVAGGQAYADSLAAAVGGQATALRDLAARAGRLDPAAPDTFAIALQRLLTGSETAVSEVSAALARPAAGTPVALRMALAAEPACAPYVG